MGGVIKRDNWANLICINFIQVPAPKSKLNNFPMWCSGGGGGGGAYSHFNMFMNLVILGPHSCRSERTYWGSIQNM